MDSPEKEPSSPNGDTSPSYPLLPTLTVEGLDPKPRTVWINPQEENEFDALLHAKFEKIPLKDFGAEVRAFRDVENFLDRTLLVLNLDKYGLDEILEAMLQKIKDDKTDGEKFSTEESMEAVYSHHSAQVLKKTIYGTTRSEGGVYFDQSWICALCELPSVSRRHVVICRLENPANLGANSQDVQFVILVVAPTKEKSTKTALETGRTFSTIFSDMSFRYQLHGATTEEEFRNILRERTRQLIREQSVPENRKSHLHLPKNPFEENEEEKPRCPFGSGMVQDIKRRLPHYWSDYKDGIIGYKTPQKLISTTLFLYFACVLPNIAFGMLNDNNTNGAIGVKKILFSQCAGGILFALFGGQPLIVLLTTAPLALYTKIIFSISEDFDLDFNAMFACVGLWNCFFLIVYSVTNVSKLMKFSSRSTEEIFSLFITFAFSADAIKDTIKDFNKYYYTPDCFPPTNTDQSLNNLTSNTSFMSTNVSDTADDNQHPCMKENSILFLLLMLGTVWFGITMFNFTKTPFLTAGKRELLADYALPAAVLIMSFFGSYVFRAVALKPFKYVAETTLFNLAPLHTLPWPAVIAAAGLGFSLSLLFFMDQNISSALVNTPSNKLKKGAAYHWDLFTVAIINGFLSIFTLPWVHAALPHSPLHVKALADMEERVDQGHVQQIVVHVRETRLTGIISHIMIGLSMFLLPYPLSYIPSPVLDGLFLYVAITALYGNQLFDRIQLFFTEQSAYPPNHYIRRVPQRKIHTFTVIQLLQLLVLCVFGFSPIPYMKMVFPILIMFLMPIRHKVVPKIISQKYLSALDGH
ncbi:solute carrier family 4 member 11-like isoform X2 [Mercenaria mercenaria]|nr:solute carrier family 4 member 11-like isoform X2 [Mercenaria mercenaria]XP_045159937.2 solute carrier family 4 member 11-like isoform X2 [Mercenaria mercenaria]